MDVPDDRRASARYPNLDHDGSVVVIIAVGPPSLPLGMSSGDVLHTC
jgi:hypothetical protein